jgi:ABC-type nickel/cobalt efflux system permease component RcnA
MVRRLLGRGCARVLGQLAVVSVVAAVVIGVAAPPASAHPLGNFSVNRYARVEVSGDVVRVYYVLDEAEIPTFQDRDALDADRAGFIRDRREAIRAGLHLTVDGVPLALDAAQTSLTLPEGQGGLSTLRLMIRFDARLPAAHGEGSLQVTLTDENEPDRIGWREIVVVARGDASVSNSTVPARDVSAELTEYPDNLLQSPLDAREATFTFRPGTNVPPVAFQLPDQASTTPNNAFTRLIDRDTVTPIALIGMIGLALLFGAGHALAPGHGKTVMAAYLVGTKGRPIDAVLLGAIVSAMHTASVLVLAAALYQVDRHARVDVVYPALTIISGVIVMGLGVYLLASRTRWRRARPTPVLAVATAPAAPVLVTVGGAAHTHLHTFTHHDHSHDHTHDRGHEHTHDHIHGHTHHDLPADVPPLSRRGLVLLATSGGLLPSPSAVIVLLAAFAAGRAALGFGLVAAFSVGLAVTLTAVGLALVFGRTAIERRGLDRGRLARWLPIGSAVVVALGGAVIAAQGIARL